MDKKQMTEKTKIFIFQMFITVNKSSNSDKILLIDSDKFHKKIIDISVAYEVTIFSNNTKLKQLKTIVYI